MNTALVKFVPEQTTRENRLNQGFCAHLHFTK